MFLQQDEPHLVPFENYPVTAPSSWRAATNLRPGDTFSDVALTEQTFGRLAAIVETGSKETFSASQRKAGQHMAVMRDVADVGTVGSYIRFRHLDITFP